MLGDFPVHRNCGAAFWLVLIAAITLLAQPVSGQAVAPPLASETSAPKVFKANARIVLLDVVVTGRNRRPVKGLRKEDFVVTEDGHPQTVNFFEEHTGAEPLIASTPVEAPNVFTNVARVKPSDAFTVLLIDSLNTPLTDQAHVRAEVLKYLKKPAPGERMAIFVLGSRLRLMQGFTDDPALLTATVNQQKKQQASPLLETTPEKSADEKTVGALAERSPEMAAALQQFLSDQTATRNDMRVQLTLAAWQQLAHYLAGFPGRKNVAWFSGAFPVAILPNADLRNPSGVQNTHQQEVRKTDALLAAAQVSIYPIAAEGVATDSIYSAGAQTGLYTRTQLAKPQQEAQERNADHSTMDEIARDTGGTAFYNTNGLRNALERATDHGSYFYTLTYTTTNLATDGRYRKINVQLAGGGGNQLAYRQGYFADDAKTAAAAAATPSPKAPEDKLSAYLRPGMLASTQVPLTLRVVRGTAPANRTGSQGGDNPDLQGPMVRYSVDFLIPAHGLEFQEEAGGKHRVSLQAALVICNREGQPVNWMLRQINLNLDAKRFQAARSTGVNLFLAIDAPAAGVTLLGGVYDLGASQAGTLEVPLNKVVDPDASASAR